MKLNRLSIAVLLLAVVAVFGIARQRQIAADSMTSAAERFIDTLSKEQRAQTVLTYDVPERTDWHYIPKPSRKGLQVKEMSAPQRKAAFDLLQSTLSGAGYRKATQIMQLEGILRELEKSKQGGAIRDPERYYFTLFGQVSPEGRWGLSVEGHHLSLNFVVDRNQVISSTPTFFGANPGMLLADYGPEFKKGMRVLKMEETLAFDLLASLDEGQRTKAIVAEKAPNDVRDAGKTSPPISPAVGLPAGEMSPKQVALLQALITEYALNLPAAVAHERLSTIKNDGVESITFAWAGADKPGIGHDYRIQGKSFLIEFNNTQPDSAGNPSNHIHSVWHHLAGNFAIGVKE